MLKTRYWIAVILIIAVLSGAACLLFWGRIPPKNTLEIWSDGTLLYTLPLSLDRVLTIDGPYGSNTVTIRDGKAAVTAASCSDHYCMKQGFRQGGPDIVCLPNRLILRFTGGQVVDS